jgi:hypothetical protein
VQRPVGVSIQFARRRVSVGVDAMIGHNRWVGESDTMARQETARPPCRIGSATGVNGAFDLT